LCVFGSPSDVKKVSNHVFVLKRGDKQRDINLTYEQSTKNKKTIVMENKQMTIDTTTITPIFVTLIKN